MELDIPRDEKAEEERDLNMVKNHVAALAEHFDTVEVFCTRHEGNAVGTTAVAWGAGNWFARLGQIRAWMRHREAEPEFDEPKDQEGG